MACRFNVKAGRTECCRARFQGGRWGSAKNVRLVVYKTSVSIGFSQKASLTFLALPKKEMRSKAIEMSLAGTPWYREGAMMRTKKDTPVYDNSADIPGKL